MNSTPEEFDLWFEMEHDTSVPYTNDPDVDECVTDYSFDDLEVDEI